MTGVGPLAGWPHWWSALRFWGSLRARVVADGTPNSFGRRGHWKISDVASAEGIEDRVHHCRRAGDGAAFAGTFGAERVGGAGDRAEIDGYRRQHVGTRDAVIQQRAGQYLATVTVTDDLFQQCLAGALGDAALNLPLRQ